MERAELINRFDGLLARAGAFRVDGVTLAKAFLTEDLLQQLEGLVFNDAALMFCKNKVTRMEFIAEGPLPLELRGEPALKTEAIYKQVIGYGLCKACRLCIEVCPKHVYRDDGFGRPDRENRREEECTGGSQCRQCVDVCPEGTIHVVLADALFKSTLFIQLANPGLPRDQGQRNDFFVANPLEAGKDLDFVLEVNGYPRLFVDSKQDLRAWAKENGHPEVLAWKALQIFQRHLPARIRQGKYRLDEILHRIIDELIHTKIDLESDAARDCLTAIVTEAFVEEPFLGAKHRPIGGLLPPGTSLAWKTPYGDEIPDYAHLEKCLGPECGLCVTQCPEGGGGTHSAIRMNLKVPEGTVASLVRGLDVHLLKLDGSHRRIEDMETLTGQSPFEFVVDPDYCKSCGICMTCCPHDVIEPMNRVFDLRVNCSGANG